jgi:hypothetical protein
VLAQSPFRNGLDATAKFRPNDNRVKLAAGLFVHGGYKWMLEQVDIPTAVAKRDDLLVWLSCGDHDYFPEADQCAILAASASPDRMKSFTLIPNCEHGGQWRWSGNDALIRSFLQAGAPPRPPAVLPTTPAIALTSPFPSQHRILSPFVLALAGGLAFLALLIAARFRRRSRV